MPSWTQTVEPGIAPVPGVCSRLVAGIVQSAGTAHGRRGLRFCQVSKMAQRDHGPLLRRQSPPGTTRAAALRGRSLSSAGADADPPLIASTADGQDLVRDDDGAWCA